jgi:hypothetical protein
MVGLKTFFGIRYKVGRAPLGAGMNSVGRRYKVGRTPLESGIKSVGRRWTPV